MFDEVNESTAILKAAPTKNDTPNGARFLYLDVDGISVPSDKYLTLSGSINHAMRTDMCRHKECSLSMTCNAQFNEEAFRNTIINRTFNVY